ncbi:MAG: PIN domain-containing protein [Acidimicrobiales bacterium]
MTVLYDAGLLIAADRNDREVWADHRARLELGVVPVTTAPVVTQVSRSSRQVQLRRLLRGCEIVAFAPEDVHEVGEILGRAGSSDVVDAHVVVAASRRGSSVITSDEEDLVRLSNCLQQPVAVHQVRARRRPPQP